MAATPSRVAVRVLAGVPDESVDQVVPKAAALARIGLPVADRP
jgi:hypothetical protein